MNNKDYEQLLDDHKEYLEAVKQACRDHDYKWPKELWTGVMFYNGHKIQIKDFYNWARMFK